MKTTKTALQPLALSLLAAALALAACSHTTPIANLPAVSMTDGIPAPAGLKKVGNVKAKYCEGEPALSTKSKTIGLIDEVTYRAQKKSKAKYIKAANIYSQTEGFFPAKLCVYLEGEAWR